MIIMIMTLMSKWIRSHGLAHLALCNGTNIWIVTSGSVSNQNYRKNFKEKAEKHWTTQKSHTVSSTFIYNMMSILQLNN